MDNQREGRLTNCSKKLHSFLEELYKQREELHSLLKDKEYLYDRFIFFDAISFKTWYHGRLREFNINPRLHFVKNTSVNTESRIEEKMYFFLDVSLSADFFSTLFVTPLEFVDGYGRSSCSNFLLYLIDENIAKIEEPQFLSSKQIEQQVDVFLENFDFKREFAKKLEKM